MDIIGDNAAKAVTAQKANAWDTMVADSHRQQFADAEHAKGAQYGFEQGVNHVLQLMGLRTPTYNNTVGTVQGAPLNGLASHGAGVYTNVAPPQKQGNPYYEIQTQDYYNQN